MKMRYRAGLAALATIAAIGIGIAPANAVPSDDEAYAEVEMKALPVTEANTIELGFEVRTDDSGTKYAVAPGAAEGDFTHAVPIVAEPDPGTVRPYTTIRGNCGVSRFYFAGRSTFQTGYQIYETYGYTISYSWNVSFHSPIDANVRNFGGLATQSWQVTAPTETEALNGQTVSGQGGGGVLTTGGYCVSGTPYDTVEW